jgi:hypothetical protein
MQRTINAKELMMKKITALCLGPLLAFAAALAHAAPYKVTFSGELSSVANQGQLSVGDLFSGVFYYDTDLVDIDPSASWGQYPGASADITVRDLHFKMNGAVFTNPNAVFGFSAQSATQMPAEVSIFVEIGFYAYVFPGFGEELPTDARRINGAPEVTFNFQSKIGDQVYYDVISGFATSYVLSAVPEPAGIVLVVCGAGVVLLKRGKKVG